LKEKFFSSLMNIIRVTRPKEKNTLETCSAHGGDGKWTNIQLDKLK
jgi:hypothetical protein